MKGRRICFVTGNANKLREVAAAVGSRVELYSRSVDLDELQGSADAIARHKCLAAAELVQGAVLVEDTGLEMVALGSLPGPYIKWFLEAVGVDGLPRLLAGWEDKRAVATCTFAVSLGPGKPVTVLQGRAEGRIVEPRAGGGPAFGWDPVFEPSEGGLGLTYAEMTQEQKQAVSHRGKAVEKLVAWLEENA